MSWFARIRQRLGEEYRVTIIKNLLYDEVGNYILTLSGWLGILSAGLLLSAILTALIIFFSPIRRLIPGYPAAEEQAQQLQLTELVTKMEHKIAQQDSFIKSMRRMTGAPEIAADLPNLPPTNNSLPASTTTEYTAVNPPNSEPNNNTNRNWKWFFPPINGNLTGKFNANTGHFAVDIVAPEQATIHAIADGIVMFSEYSVETGHVIGIYHPDRFVSFYKHNSRNLKDVGSPVQAGEAIAVIGNSGKHTTGPHLHFELWHNGVPVDPTNYIRLTGK